MRAVLAAVLVVCAVPVAVPADPPPLAEVRRVPFEPSFDAVDGGQLDVEFHPTARVAYAVSDRHLFVLDPVTGEELGGVDLGALAAPTYSARWDLATVGDRLVAWAGYPGLLAVFDVRDPARPGLVAFTTVWDRPAVGGVYDDGYFVLCHGYNRCEFISTDTFRVRSVVPHALPPSSVIEAAGSPGADVPLLVVRERTYSTPSSNGIALYDVAAGMPSLRFVRQTDAYPGSIVADRTGDLLVAEFESYQPERRAWVETIDAHSGVTLASWDVPPGTALSLAEGGGRRLVQRDATGLEFVDLADPSAPEEIGRVEVPLRTYYDERTVAASVRDPVLFVASREERVVIAVDPRTATEISRLSIEGAAPFRVVMQEPGDGSRRGLVVSWRYDDHGALARGGRSHLDLADLTNPAAPAVTGRFLRNQPRSADGVAAIGGRYAVVYEIDSNALALVDLAEGRVVQVTGAAALLGEFDVYDAPELRTAGRFAVLGGEDGWETFELAGGRLEPRRSRILRYGSREWYDGVALAPDGKVVAAGSNLDTGAFLETVGPDGRSARVPRRSSRLLATTLSPAGDLAALVMPEFSEDSPVDVWDVADAAAPKLLWSDPGDVSDAVFDPTGTRLLVSGPLFSGTFAVRAFDARTGVPLGPEGPGVPKFYYHGFGAQWIANGKWRAIYWKWSFLGWRNALLDLSEPEPTLLQVYPDTGSFPEFAPRDGGGWYEVDRDPWDNLANLVIGTPEGDTVETGTFPGDHSGISAVRRGFAATWRGGDGSVGISVWRDAALNRPPVVVAGEDRVLECTGPEGATARLDASGSHDPDSSPGTDDDLAAIAWTVDGTPVASEAIAEVGLPLGAHRARAAAEDVLGATGSAEVEVDVADRVAPDLDVALEPVFDGAVFTRRFRPIVKAEDTCDPAPSSSALLRLPALAIGAPVDWERAVAPAFEIRSGPRGARVVVLGPDETAARAAWDDAVRAGGFALGPDANLETGGPSRTVLWRFETDGGALVRAIAYAGSDLEVGANVEDASGNAASTSASLLAAIDAACTALPPGTHCADR